jgi:type III pantothenate kinase
MLLACDIGNTNIKTGLFSGDSLIEKKIFDNPDSFRSYLRTCSAEQFAVSSVVPELTGIITGEISIIKNSIPFIITRKVKFNLKIAYDSPETLGIDRVCSAEGAYALYKNSDSYKSYNKSTYIISIDSGTATTINIVSYPAVFTGGIIAPGISMMFDALNSRTAQLPKVSEKSYESFIGRNTASSIASGVLNSAAGLITNTLSYLKSELGAEDLKIFITGGNAGKLLPYLKFNYTHIPELVLLGVKSIYDKNLN